jgi:molybdopterin-guanine dinucleotide biosynthesis protein B
LTAVFVVSGPSGSGKTTLLEKLIRELTGRGLRVGAGKHDPHGHVTVDTPGKDSWRLARAGAVVVDVLGPAARVSFARAPGSTNLPPSLSGEALACDIVLVEGFKEGHLARLEIVPHGSRPRLEPGTLALITDQLLNCSLPVFARDDVPQIADFLRTRIAPETTMVVLAGGASSRMGRDKATLALPDGETMLERAISASRAVSPRVLVVTRHATHEPLARRAGAELTIDEGPQHPASGLIAALKVRGEGSSIVAAPCDSPELRPAVLARLAELQDEADFGCFAIGGRLHPLPGMFRPGTIPHLEEIARRSRPLYELASQVQSSILSEHEARNLDPTLDSFASVNTYADLKAMGGRETPAAPPPAAY